MSRNAAIVVLVLALLFVGWVLYNNANNSTTSTSTTTSESSETSEVGEPETLNPPFPDGSEATSSGQTATGSATPQ